MLVELALGGLVELALVEMVMAELALVGMVLAELAPQGNHCRWCKFGSDRYCTEHRSHHSCRKS